MGVGVNQFNFQQDVNSVPWLIRIRLIIFLEKPLSVFAMLCAEMVCKGTAVGYPVAYLT